MEEEKQHLAGELGISRELTDLAEGQREATAAAAARCARTHAPPSSNFGTAEMEAQAQAACKARASAVTANLEVEIESAAPSFAAAPDDSK